MKMWFRYIKENKWTSMAIILSMTFAIALFVCILVIRDTDDFLDKLTTRYLDEPYDITFNDINLRQSESLAFIPEIEHIGFYGVNAVTSDREKQHVAIVSANEDYILRQSILKEGRIPSSENELIAEEWVLRNFGINPKIGSKIKLKIRKEIKNNNKKIKTMERQYEVVGIISDNPHDKLKGSMQLYTAFNIDTKLQSTSAAIKLFDGVDGRTVLKKIIGQCSLKKKQAVYSEDTFDLLDTSLVFNREDVYLLIMLWIISGVIIYGVYRICVIRRRKEYGLLQALGMKHKKIFSLMLKEMSFLYFLGLLGGTFIGILVAYGINIVSESAKTSFVFWGQQVKFTLKIPWVLVFISYILISLLILSIVVMSYRQVKNEPILQKLKENECETSVKYHKLIISEKQIKLSYVILALKNLGRDAKCTLLVALSIGLASVLVVSLKFEAKLNETLNEEKCKVENLDGNFRLEEYNDLTTVTGITKNSLKTLKKLPEVSSIETAELMPARLIKDKSKKINNEYIDSLNLAFQDSFYKSISGYDGKDYVYKNSLKGFNRNALKKLKKYVMEGNYDPETLSGDQAILFMPQISNEGGYTGYIKNGTYVMNYKTGDQITIKFRKDLDVSSNEYWELKDKKAEYNYHTFKIAAIVYYPYMTETSSIGSLLPDIIISEQQFEKLTGIKVCSVVNINTVKTKIKDQKILQNKIISIAQNDTAVASRNITEEKENRDSMIKKENIYKYGVAVIAYIIALLNAINLIKYRILSRKRELNVYRAVGLREKRLIQISVIEGTIYAIIAAFITMTGYFSYSYYI